MKRGPLRSPAFRMLVAGRAIDAFGNSFAPIALAFAVLDLTGSASDLGLVVGVRMTLNILFLLFGGALADRLPKNLLMVGASIAAALTQATVATVVLTGGATIPLLVGLAALNGVAGALALPASAAIVPQLVAREELQQANALNRMLFNGAMIIGAPAAGVVVAAVGPGWGIAVDATTFLVAAGCFALVRTPAPAAASPSAEEAEPSRWPAVFGDLRAGWSEFRHRTWLWAVVAGAAILNATWNGALFVLGPLVADETIGRQSWGFVLAAQTAGMVVGALVAMRLRIRRLLGFGVLCLAVASAPVFALGLYPHVLVLAGTGVLCGVALEQFGVAWETTMQEHVPADTLARVYSYDMVGSFAAIPIGMIAIGPIAETVGVRSTMIGAGIAMLIAVLAMLCVRDVRRLRHRIPERTVRPAEKAPA